MEEEVTANTDDETGESAKETTEEKIQPISKKEKTQTALIEEMKVTSESLKKENDRKEQLLIQEEKLLAEKERVGRGVVSVPEKKEETAKEYKDKAMRGELNE